MAQSASDTQAPPVAKPSRWKRRLKWASIVTLVAFLSGTFLVRDHVRTLRSLRRVPGTNTYVMDYYCDYHMDEIRSGGIDVRNVEDSYIEVLFPDFFLPIVTRIKRSYLPHEIVTAAEGGDHCSTAALTSEDGKVFFGRNCDWHNDACLIVRVHDQDGLASISVLDLEYLNLNRSDLNSTSILERLPLLFAPYYLMDGMNRHGVAISSMSVDADPPRESGKPAIIHSSLMRLILDYAQDVDEAVELVQEFNVYFVEVSGSHLMVADSSGRSRIIEFIDGEIQVTPSAGPWQVCTNHVIWNKTEQENDSRSSRYRTGSEIAEGLGGLVQYGDALRVIRSMAVEDFTMWTSVYDLTAGEAHILYKSNPEMEYRDSFSLEKSDEQSGEPDRELPR